MNVWLFITPYVWSCVPLRKCSLSLSRLLYTIWYYHLAAFLSVHLTQKPTNTISRENVGEKWEKEEAKCDKDDTVTLTHSLIVIFFFVDELASFSI